MFDSNGTAFSIPPIYNFGSPEARYGVSQRWQKEGMYYTPAVLALTEE
jgi:hypothetical protein